jgi:hypothetical protein
VNLFGTAKSVLLAALATAALAAPSQASTINEGSLAGGDFSGLRTSPTAIANGFDVVTGSLSAGDFDYLHFTNMTPGASSVSFTITAPAGRVTAQGRVYYSTTAFSATNLGTLAGNIRITPGQPGPQAITFNLGPSFAGSLYVSLNLSLGPVMRYSVSIPGNVTIPGVPVPAPVFMLGAALAGMGALSRRRQRKADGQSAASHDGFRHGHSIV